MSVFKAIKDGRLTVFPTETIARSFITRFAKDHPSQAVFVDSVISWDTFKGLCAKAPENRNRVTDAHRLLFSYSYLSREKNQGHFFNPSYRETLWTAACELSGNLPYMKKALRQNVKSSLDPSMAQEIERIEKEYEEFLSSYSLYDEKYLEPDFFRKEIRDKNPIIMYPGNISDSDIDRAIEAGIETCTPEGSENTIECYPNSLFEIKAVVRRIYELLKNGAEPEDIAITCARLEELEPYMESEALKYGIKLTFVRSRKLTDWASGSFFTSVSALKARDFDLKVMKNFLLNPRFPFRDRSLCARVIQRAVNCKIQSGEQNWLYKTKRDEETGPFVRKLIDYINGITSSKDADSLRRALKGFQDDFFIEGSWSSAPDSGTQARVFMVCMDTLDEIEKIQSIKPGIPFYEFFLNLISGIYYAPGKGEEGIKVYKYPVSCPLSVPYHFIMALDDESARQYRTLLPFTDDRNEGSILHRKNISDEICSSLTDGFLSFSKETSSSFTIAPSYFEQRGLVRNAEIKRDLFEEEEALWRGEGRPSEKSLKSQAELFRKAEGTVFPFVTGRKKEPSPINDRIRLSSTSMSSFKKCPLSWKYTYLDKVEEEDFDIDEEDAIKIGNLIHGAYEKYFTLHPKVSDLSSYENQDELRSIFEELLEKYEKSDEGPGTLQIERIRNRYPALLPLIGEVDAYREYTVRDMEYKIRFQEENYYVDGRVDCILSNPKGELAVIDFKKKSGDKSSPQLAFYAVGMKEDEKEKYCCYPLYAAFYGVEEHKNTVMWKDQQGLYKNLEEFRMNVEEVVSEIRKGEFDPTPGDENCKNCGFRRVCRTRYVIK
ncbi:MAG: PD-(D/E)XK nuclease family protein [Sphaerochaetaceae bacterium]|nr:PD-(D/E)XK nuclease family protein [Sphaerochaetaceae bacterium]